MAKSNISHDKIRSTSTDGGVPAMIDKEKESVEKIKYKHSEIFSYKCITNHI